MDSAAILKDKFSELLAQTTAFFTALDPDPAQEQTSMEVLRQSVLSLAQEAEHPLYDRFLAYLLSVTDIEAQYPLQVIRFAALAARLGKTDEALKKASFEELVLAAYLADMGFRAAWLGQRTDHRSTAVFRLKEMSLKWFSPIMEKWMLSHHDLQEDSSPLKILSTIARYLSLAYGAGEDRHIAETRRPAQTIEALMEEPGSTPGMKSLLRLVSAYPLGSWVQLSTGECAIVIGNNSANPMRPSVGLYRPDAKGQVRWEEHILKTELTLQIAREIDPTPLQLEFSNTPCLWIPGWGGEPQRPIEQLQKGFQPEIGASSVPSKHTQKMEAMLHNKPMEEQSVGTPSVGWGNTGEWTKTENVITGKQLKTSQDELQHVRSDWEKHVLTLEDAITKLKRGVIDSYRRETGQYRSLLEHLSQDLGPLLQQQGGALPTPEPSAEPVIPSVPLSTPAPQPAAAPSPAVTTLDPQLEEKMTQVKRHLEETAGELALHTDPTEEQRLSTTVLQQWRQELSRFEDAVHRPSASPADVGLRQSELARLDYAVGTLRALLIEKRALANFQQGLDLRAKKSWRSAATRFEEAAQLKPDFWEALAYAGLCLLYVRDAAAIPLLEKALQGQPHQQHLQACLELARKLPHA